MSTNSIEFIGGPYDGHRQPPPARLDERLSIEVSRDVFAVLEGRSGWGAPVTSVAVYDLDGRRGAYRFVGSLAPAGK
jgi:hypothetical protein